MVVEMIAADEAARPTIPTPCARPATSFGTGTSSAGTSGSTTLSSTPRRGGVPGVYHQLRLDATTTSMIRCARRLLQVPRLLRAPCDSDRSGRRPARPYSRMAWFAVYDKDPKTPTFLFERGDEKRPVKEKPLDPGSRGSSSPARFPFRPSTSPRGRTTPVRGRSSRRKPWPRPRRQVPAQSPPWPRRIVPSSIRPPLKGNTQAIREARARGNPKGGGGLRPGGTSVHTGPGQSRGG